MQISNTTFQITIGPLFDIYQLDHRIYNWLTTLQNTRDKQNRREKSKKKFDFRNLTLDSKKYSLKFYKSPEPGFFLYGTRSKVEVSKLSEETDEK